jgi:hypothetical protein
MHCSRGRIARHRDSLCPDFERSLPHFTRAILAQVIEGLQFRLKFGIMNFFMSVEMLAALLLNAASANQQ